MSLFIIHTLHPAGGYSNDISSPAIKLTSTLLCSFVFVMPQEVMSETFIILHIRHYFRFATG
jgi:hypothetical protein